MKFDNDTFGGENETVKEHDLKVDIARAEKQADWATSNGFAPPPTWFDVGTRLIEIGKDNLRTQRAEVAKLPDRDDGLDAIAGSVKDENRETHTRPIAHLRMGDDGTLSTLAGLRAREAGKDVLGLYFEPRAFTQLVDRARSNGSPVPKGAASYLRDCPLSMRVEHVNRWLEQCNDDAMVQIRTRNGQGPRRAFAVVSPSYAEFDADAIAAMLKKVLPADAKIDALRDGYRSRITALWHTDTDAERFSVGEFTKAGIVVKSADDGSGALHVDAILWRAICLNLTQVPATQRQMSRRHIGSRNAYAGQNTRRISQDLRYGVRAALSTIDPFLSAWKAAKNYTLASDAEGMVKVFGKLAQSKRLHVTGVKPKEMTDRLINSWARETPDYSKAAIVNAATRAAHEYTWPSPWAVDDLQEQAGQLVYVQVRAV